MTKVDTKKETCSCQVCRSDLAYVAPCDFEDALEFEIVFTDDELRQLQRETEE